MKQREHWWIVFGGYGGGHWWLLPFQRELGQGFHKTRREARQAAREARKHFKFKYASLVTSIKKVCVKERTTLWLLQEFECGEYETLAKRATRQQARETARHWWYRIHNPRIIPEKVPPYKVITKVV